MTTIYSYSGCSTCKKALAWLSRRGVKADIKPIVEAPPSAKQLREWVRLSGRPASKWFNTSGLSYRALVEERGKESVSALNEAEIIALLAADGKLIKRPVLIREEVVLVGFKEPEWEAAFG